MDKLIEIICGYRLDLDVVKVGYVLTECVEFLWLASPQLRSTDA